MGTKIVIDTNVLVSAVGWGGMPMDVLSTIQNKYELVISSKQLDEILKVIAYPRINLVPERRIRLLQILHDLDQFVELQQTLDIIKEDPSDNIILETAVEYNAEYLITGDKHLLKLKQYKNTKIVTPKEFLIKTGRMAQDKEGHIAWIWDPEGVKKYLSRKDLEWKPLKRSKSP